MRQLAVLLLCASAAAPAQKLKLYISADMEGVAGVVTGDQLSPAGFEYARFREFMTREVLAAVGAAQEAGATEILVSDSHGNGENLLVEMFPKEVRLVRSWPRRQGMMAGLDASFDAAMFLGYHASTNNPRGVRAHTISSARLTRIALNGAAVTEGALNAAVAGHYGVPVILISGDDAAIEEVRAAIGPIEGAETKRTLGFHSANTLTPEAAREVIARKVKAALARRRDFQPYRLKAPVTVDVSFKNYLPAEALSYLRIIERPDSHSIRFRAQDILEASDFLMFLNQYSPGMEP